MHKLASNDRGIRQIIKTTLLNRGAYQRVGLRWDHDEILRREQMVISLMPALIPHDGAGMIDAIARAFQVAELCSWRQIHA